MNVFMQGEDLIWELEDSEMKFIEEIKQEASYNCWEQRTCFF